MGIEEKRIIRIAEELYVRHDFFGRMRESDQILHVLALIYHSRLCENPSYYGGDTP